MNVQVETVTPVMAAEILSRHAANRKISGSYIERYAQDMAAGNWKMNGSSIVIDKEGNLIDGQHRLMACSQSGCSFDTVVVRGADEDAYTTIDQGRGRMVKDALRLAGEVDTNRLASALGTLWLYENDWSMQRKKDTVKTQLANAGRARLSATELFDVLGRHPKIRFSISLMGNLPYKNIQAFMPVTMAAAMHRVFAEESSQKLSDDFMRLVATGAELDYGHPILMLRNSLMNARARRHNIMSGGGLEKRVIYIGLLIKTWNAWRTGKTIGLMSFRRGEEIQKIVGGHKAA